MESKSLPFARNASHSDAGRLEDSVLPFEKGETAIEKGWDDGFVAGFREFRYHGDEFNRLDTNDMIAWITGKNRGIRNGSVIVETGGIGYKVSVSAYVLGKVAGTEEVSFHIHTHVREDILALYGFLSEDELTVFEALISVSGIGPKAALGILSIADTDTIRTAIVNKDPSLLTQVSGIGKKTAERVIVELQNKVSAPTNASGRTTTADGDAIEALLSLGYKVSEARDALKAVPEGVKDVGEKVRAALRLLGKKK